MAKNRNEKHFGENKKDHTKIKHAIFSKTLFRSLSIANGLSYKNPNATYSYADLFAGKGTFEDGSFGSPLIALDTFIKHIKQSSTANNFKRINVLGIEKNKEDFESLVKTLNQKLENDCNDKCGGKIRVGAGNDSWENFQSTVKDHLSNGSWGFVFADPFSTELDIQQFTDHIKDVSKVKDIMIFANFNTLVRQNGRLHQNDAERLSKAMGLPIEVIISDEDFSDRFQNAFSAQLNKFKDFAIGVAFPIDIKKKGLIAADYFYLILGTNSIKVADGFLEAYAEELVKYKKSLMCNTLFDDSSIIDFLKDKDDGVTLYDLLNYLFNNFLSWKNCGSSNDIPTIANTIAKINKMIDLKEIELDCPEEFRYKRNMPAQGNKIGHLKNSSISHRKDTEAVTLIYLPQAGQQAFMF